MLKKVNLQIRKKVHICVTCTLPHSATRMEVLNQRMLSVVAWGHQEEWEKEEIPYSFQDRMAETRAWVADADPEQELPRTLYVVVRAENKKAFPAYRGVDTSWYANLVYISKEKAEEEAKKAIRNDPERKTRAAWVVPVHYWRS